MSNMLAINGLTFVYDTIGSGVFRITGCLETGVQHVCIVTDEQIVFQDRIPDERLRYFLQNGTPMANQAPSSGIPDVTEALNLAVEEPDDEQPIPLPDNDESNLPEIPEETSPED